MTCDQQEKVFVSSKGIIVNFSTNKKFYWTVCWIKPFISGFGLIPLNIVLQQDDRTVCCGHNTVVGDGLSRYFGTIIQSWPPDFSKSIISCAKQTPQYKLNSGGTLRRCYSRCTEDYTLHKSSVKWFIYYICLVSFQDTFLF